ncbi:MAG: PAS domain-containing sensor histidine kinase [Sulfuricellaceae bacterium]|jgi:signal transduction histidine kinase
MKIPKPFLALANMPPLSGLRHSLLWAMLAVLTLSIALMSSALFFGIDYFVSGKFNELREQRTSRASLQAKAVVERELGQLAGLAALLADDAELRNSAYYHLFLDGEKAHPMAAVRRIAESFRLESVSLWDMAGRPVAAFGSVPPSPAVRQGMVVSWVGRTPWLVTSAPLRREGRAYAVLQLARPLSPFLEAVFPAGSEVMARVVADGAGRKGLQRVDLPGAAGKPTWLEVDVQDSVGPALSRVKSLLAWIMAVFGLLLTLALGAFLGWQLKPLRALTQAASAVGRGDFGGRLSSRGSNEIARLVEAFNGMSGDLARLRELERRMRQQERLSDIGRMAARVAHDINNPLTVIRNVARLMEKQPAGEAGQIQEDSRLIVHHSERCMRTVEMLLAYGRPVRLKAARHDLNELVAEIAGRWRGAWPDTALSVVPADGPVWVEADVYQLEQMLANLLDNARQAAPGGEVVLDLVADGEWSRIAVTDSGPGFSPEALARLYEPFFTTKSGGNGLGLVSALAIAQAHGGDIAIRPGAPGRVEVSLPTVDDHAQRPGR